MTDIPGTMTAAVLTGHGGPEMLIVRDDVPVPKAAAGEVLIRVGGAGINNTDIWSREGAYGTPNDPHAVAGWQRVPLDFPRIQGMDVAGRVVAVGDGVDPARVGERVLVYFVLPHPRTGIVDADLIGSERDGGFAEYCAVPSENAVAVDTDLDDAELASFPVAYLTAEHMLARARVAAGEIVLVTGASGGVGTALLQLAAVRGARPIALVGAGKEPPARAAGAAWVAIRDERPLAEALTAAGVRDRPAVVADVVGGRIAKQAIDLLARGGRYVTAGAIAGPLIDLDLRTLYLNHLELIGSSIGERSEFETLVGHISAGRLTPNVAARFPLRDIGEAQRAFVAKKFSGKLVVVP